MFLIAHTNISWVCLPGLHRKLHLLVSKLIVYACVCMCEALGEGEVELGILEWDVGME